MARLYDVCTLSWDIKKMIDIWRIRAFNLEYRVFGDGCLGCLFLVNVTKNIVGICLLV